MKKVIVFSLCTFLCIMMISCGVSKRALEDAEKRVTALSEKGVPDSSLSRAKVFLYQAKDAKQRGNVGLAKMSSDSMRILIAQAEAQYEDNMNRLKPWIQQQKQHINQATAHLTGLHKKHADSLMGVIDSFIQLNWLLQAEAYINDFVAYIPKLKSDEERAEELRPRIPGTWTCLQATKHSEDKTVHAKEYKIFTFRKDGSIKLVEKKSGKSTPYFKEDWEFQSFGKYDIKGDTIVLFIERFKAAKQNFWDLKTDDKGRKKWIKSVHGTYDSVITDGSQDRFITFHDLKMDFKR